MIPKNFPRILNNTNLFLQLEQESFGQQFVKVFLDNKKFNEQIAALFRQTDESRKEDAVAAELNGLLSGNPIQRDVVVELDRLLTENPMQPVM